MKNYPEIFFKYFNNAYFDWFRDLLDIALVSYLIYRGLLLIKGTRAVQLIKGLILLFLFYYVVNNYLQLRTMAWIMQQAATIIIVALPIVFQPELRRLLAHIGKERLISETFFSSGKELFDFSNNLVLSVKNLSLKRTGALIVIEKKNGLNEFIETGIKIDALVSPDLIESIFYSGTPLHDGAIIIRKNKILAASVLLPLSENIKKITGKHNLGTRHRAALGLSENSDAICIVVSEETGRISVANNGKLQQNLRDEDLEKLLIDNFQVNPNNNFKITKIFNKKDLELAEKQLQKKKSFFPSLFANNLNIILVSMISALFLIFFWGKNFPLAKQNKIIFLPIEIHKHNFFTEKKLFVAPTHIRIKIEGSSGIVNEIKPTDFKASVTIKDPNSQEQMLPISIFAPDQIVIKEIEPSKVNLIIK